MPDADDFDIESLRALLRGEPPAPAKDARPETAPAPGRTGAATRGKGAGAKAKEKPSAPGRAKGSKATATGKKPRKL